jgi:hypothetical protein
MKAGKNITGGIDQNDSVPSINDNCERRLQVDPAMAEKI